jgi:DNA repair protein RecO (recombination protein O)
MPTANITLRDAAFVLHTLPYSETSLIAEVFAREHGRVSVLAKGARSATSKLRGMVAAFNRLDLTASGKSELKTLRSADYAEIAPQLTGDALLAAFYLNELLLRLLGKEDAHPALFDAYADAISELRAARSASVARILRQFERTLLIELGYAIEFDRTADTQERPRASATYWLIADRGVLAEDPHIDVPSFSGEVLLHTAAGVFDAPSTANGCRDLMRYLINTRLEGRTLNTRSLLRELKGLA